MKLKFDKLKTTSENLEVDFGKTKKLFSKADLENIKSNGIDFTESDLINNNDLDKIKIRTTVKGVDNYKDFTNGISAVVQPKIEKEQTVSILPEPSDRPINDIVKYIGEDIYKELKSEELTLYGWINLYNDEFPIYTDTPSITEETRFFSGDKTGIYLIDVTDKIGVIQDNRYYTNNKVFTDYEFQVQWSFPKGDPVFYDLWIDEQSTDLIDGDDVYTYIETTNPNGNYFGCYLRHNKNESILNMTGIFIKNREGINTNLFIDETDYGYTDTASSVDELIQVDTLPSDMTMSIIKSNEGGAVICLPYDFYSIIENDFNSIRYIIKLDESKDYNGLIPIITDIDSQTSVSPIVPMSVDIDAPTVKPAPLLATESPSIYDGNFIEICRFDETFIKTCNGILNSPYYYTFKANDITFNVSDKVLSDNTKFWIDFNFGEKFSYNELKEDNNDAYIDTDKMSLNFVWNDDDYLPEHELSILLSGCSICDTVKVQSLVKQPKMYIFYNGLSFTSNEPQVGDFIYYQEVQDGINHLTLTLYDSLDINRRLNYLKDIPTKDADSEVDSRWISPLPYDDCYNVEIISQSSPWDSPYITTRADDKFIEIFNENLKLAANNSGVDFIEVGDKLECFYGDLGDFTKINDKIYKIIWNSYNCDYPIFEETDFVELPTNLDSYILFSKEPIKLPTNIESNIEPTILTKSQSYYINTEDGWKECSVSYNKEVLYKCYAFDGNEILDFDEKLNFYQGIFVYNNDIFVNLSDNPKPRANDLINIKSIDSGYIPSVNISENKVTIDKESYIRYPQGDIVGQVPNDSNNFILFGHVGYNEMVKPVDTYVDIQQYCTTPNTIYKIHIHDSGYFIFLGNGESLYNICKKYLNVDVYTSDQVCLDFESAKPIIEGSIMYLPM